MALEKWTTEQLYTCYLQHPLVETDTRKLQQGNLFFALKGENFDGNDYALQALEQGAAYAVIDREALAGQDKRLILVDNVLNSLQQLALHHRQQLAIPFLAITGSNGKTTTKELIYSVLSTTFRTVATIGNLNNHIGVPLTILSIPPDTEIAVVEMGANHQGEIAAYCNICRPNYGLITNVGKAHLEGFGGLEGVKKGKGELYDFLRREGGTIFRNTDLDYLIDMANGIAQQITYGTTETAQIQGRLLSSALTREAGPRESKPPEASPQPNANPVASEEGGLLNLELVTADGKLPIHTLLVGNYNLANVLAAAAVGGHFGVPLEKIKTALEAYQPSNSRSQLLQLGSNRLILDAYNANPSSMKLALENLATLPSSPKWALLGSMKEMGTASLAEHQAVVELCERLGLENVLLCGEEYKATRHAYRWFENSSELKEFLEQYPLNNATILIKGSRGSKMETALEAFR